MDHVESVAEFPAEMEQFQNLLENVEEVPSSDMDCYVILADY